MTGSSRLAEVAGSRMYQRNAFRITGLATDATPSQVRRRQQQLTAQLAVGADAAVPAFLGDRAGEAVRAAFETLGDPRRRIVDELLWTWGAPDGGCGCSADAHEGHDAAVRAHSAALDEELATWTDRAGQDDLWAEAAQRWETAIAAEDTWAHLRARVAELDDPRLTDAEVAELRGRLPAALVAPLVELAAADRSPTSLMAVARRWPVPEDDLDRCLLAAAAPSYEAVGAHLQQLHEMLRESSPHEVMKRVERDVEPILRRLDELAPADRFRETRTIFGQVATLMHNCAVIEFEIEYVGSAGRVDRWYGRAEELASSPEQKDAIAATREVMNGEVTGMGELREECREAARSGRRTDALQVVTRLRAQATLPGQIRELDAIHADIRTTPVVRPGRRKWPRIAAAAFVVYLVVVVIGVLLQDEEGQSTASTIARPKSSSYPSSYPYPSSRYPAYPYSTSRYPSYPSVPLDSYLITPAPDPSGPRPADGKVLTSRGAKGKGELSIENGGEHDAVVTLADESGKARRAIYSRAGETTKATGIADGTYTVYVESGTAWNNDERRFTADQDASRFEQTARFRTVRERGGYQYTVLSITLQPVLGGNSPILPVDPGGVPK